MTMAIKDEDIGGVKADIRNIKEDMTEIKSDVKRLLAVHHQQKGMMAIIGAAFGMAGAWISRVTGIA